MTSRASSSLSPFPFHNFFSKSNLNNLIHTSTITVAPKTKSRLLNNNQTNNLDLYSYSSDAATKDLALRVADVSNKKSTHPLASERPSPKTRAPLLSPFQGFHHLLPSALSLLTNNQKHSSPNHFPPFTTHHLFILLHSFLPLGRFLITFFCNLLSLLISDFSSFSPVRHCLTLELCLYILSVANEFVASYD